MTTLEKRLQLRELYKYWNEKDSPYTYLDCYKELSKTEYNFWDDLRMRGITMFPEFPVGPYFIDFTMPNIKLGVEIDGKEWHKDKEKDIKRQKYIEEQGWEIIRIEGWETLAYEKEPDYEGLSDEEQELEYNKFYSVYGRYIDIIKYLKRRQYDNINI